MTALRCVCPFTATRLRLSRRRLSWKSSASRTGAWSKSGAQAAQYVLSPTNSSKHFDRIDIDVPAARDVQSVERSGRIRPAQEHLPAENVVLAREEARRGADQLGSAHLQIDQAAAQDRGGSFSF